MPRRKKITNSYADTQEQKSDDDLCHTNCNIEYTKYSEEELYKNFAIIDRFANQKGKKKKRIIHNGHITSMANHSFDI